MERESSVPCLSGLLCIISGESALLIQCMKITFIETFIKAVRANLIHQGRTWRRGKPICQSLPSASTPFLLSPISERPMLDSLGSGLMAGGRKLPEPCTFLQAGSCVRLQLCASPQLCKPAAVQARSSVVLSLMHSSQWAHIFLGERTARVASAQLPAPAGLLGAP